MLRNAKNPVYSEITRKLDGLKSIRKAEQKNVNPEINELRNKLKTIELAEAQIADTFTKDGLSVELIEILSKRATKLKNDKTELLLKIDELKSKAIDTKTAVNLSKKWKTASFEEKRAVCSVLINRIIIDVDGSTEIVWNI